MTCHSGSQRTQNPAGWGNKSVARSEKSCKVGGNTRGGGKREILQGGGTRV